MNSEAQHKLLDMVRSVANNSFKEDKGEVRLWDTFILIFDYFLDVIKHYLKDFENTGRKMKDKKIRTLMLKIEPSSQVREKWDRVVAMLANGPAPYNNILQVDIILVFMIPI